MVESNIVGVLEQQDNTVTFVVCLILKVEEVHRHNTGCQEKNPWSSIMNRSELCQVKFWSPEIKKEKNNKRA